METLGECNATSLVKEGHKLGVEESKKNNEYKKHIIKKENQSVKQKMFFNQFYVE